MKPNKTALITGGSGKLASVIALKFAEIGYHIALHYNSNQATALKIQQEIGDDKCKIYQYDFANLDGIEQFFSQIESDFAHHNIELLINASNLFEKSNLADVCHSYLQKIYNINLFAPLVLSQQFANYICKKSICKKSTQGGANIINFLDSYISKNASPYFAYLLAKKNFADLTKMQAREYAPNIRVNGISPGILSCSQDMDAEFIARKRQELPLQKIFSPAEIANLCLNLVSHQYITGQIINIDSGEHLL